MSEFFNTIGKLETESRAEDILLPVHEYLINKLNAECNSECFYLINDYDDNDFDALPIEDVEKMLNNIQESPNLGNIEYILPFGKISINFITNNPFNINYIMISAEDFVIEKSRQEFYYFILEIHFRFNLLQTIGGWGLGHYLEEIRQNIYPLKYELLLS
ncbi:hypothetical protein [Chryseobacterium sp. EO14]|uniref:hypothetical protein n=1 Tax=Chryseobacterium sp. EO14 TaxID=2950551 RepID=UPI0021097CFF|nr:hypothetical protein [Chryseobacterium sp. EO14]MCQ4139115.1 hypothetical protein [Chryseobacterium sp. EO14]